MSVFANVAAATGDLSRANVTAVRRRLREQWRDGHASAFDRDILQPLEVSSRRLVTAIEKADAEVDAVLVGLRDLGGDI